MTDPQEVLNEWQLSLFLVLSIYQILTSKNECVKK